MKKVTLIAVALLAVFTTVEVNASEARVVDVQPNYITKTTYDYITYDEEKCGIASRSDRGLIEKANNGLFGSLEGTLGTAIGYGIGNEVGGGSGNEIAKVVFALAGNKIGNDIGDRRRINNGQIQCHIVPTTIKQPRTVQEISHYNITVELEEGRYLVRRNYAPAIGSYINVSVTVR